MTRFKLQPRALPILLLALLPGSLLQADEGFDEEYAPRRFYASAGVGFDYSTGDYGDPVETEMFSHSLSVKLEYEPPLPGGLEVPLTLRVLVPYVLVDGPDDVLPGEGATAIGRTPSSMRHGIGDIFTSLTYTYYPDRQYVPFVDVSTKLKIPSASTAKNLGTGHADVSFGLEVTEVLGPVSVFGGAAYRLKGGSDFRNIWLASLGTNVTLGRRASVGLAYDFRQASTGGVGDSHEISPFVSLRVSDSLRFSPYGVIGLSTNSPAWGLGGTFQVKF
jgi:hypothetical protein